LSGPDRLVDNGGLAGILTFQMGQMDDIGRRSPTATATEAAGKLRLPPVVPLPVEQVVQLRSIVAADAEARALADELARRAAALSLSGAEPRPVTEIAYSGLVGTDPRRIDCIARLEDMARVGLLVQHLQAVDDRQAVDVLRRFMRAWTATYRITGDDVNEDKLLPLVVAWHVLRDGAPAALRRQVEPWVDTLGRVHAEAVSNWSQHLTNRYAKHLRLVAHCALALGCLRWLELARRGIERFVECSLRADGSSLDLEHRDTLTYHASALSPLLEVAMLLGEEGRALYAWTAPSGGSLQRSTDYVVPYATGARQRREWVHSRSALDHRRAEAGIEYYRPGRLFEPIQARTLMTFASYFDPALRQLALALSLTGAERYADWRLVVQDAIAASLQA